MARERMAMSYPTPPPSRSDNQSDTSSLSHDRIPELVEQEERRRSIRKQDPELAAIASKLVEQVLAKVVAEECMRIPSSYVEERETEREKDEVKICPILITSPSIHVHNHWMYITCSCTWIPFIMHGI